MTGEGQMPGALRIGLLGPLQVRDEAGRLVSVGGRQLRVLFTLLALNAGRVVPSSSIAEQIWPDDPPGHPGNALQTLVSRLRAELRLAGVDNVIESHPAGYRLAVQPDAVDVTAFEAQAAQGRRALADGDAQTAAPVLRDALLAWRGQPLADAAGCDFAAAAAARLTELRSSVLTDRIEADLALGEGATLVGELRGLLRADPLAERPRALLMRALYAAGRQAEALAVYAEVRELLASQLGVDPSAQLEHVYLRILRGEEGLGAVAKGRPRPHDHIIGAERTRASVPGAPSVPRPRSALTSFVGRDAEVSQMLKNLDAVRLVTLTGPGGVGKTRLATVASGRLDVAAWFVPLAPVTDPAEVPYAVLEALGIREAVIARRAGDPAAGPLDRLTAALADRDEVMVLDNCEHVIEAAAALAARILADCPRMRIVATSRQPLRIDGEVLRPILPLPVPPADPDPRTPGASGSAATSAVLVASYGSVRLLRDRAVAVRPDFELDEANAAAVARICRSLDGMPLAIELAAVWLRTLTPAQLAVRLDDRFALLTGGSRTALPKHRTLRAVVDWSWDLLSASEQVLARRLAIFPGGATLAAIEQVCADARLPSAAVLPALSGLVDKSILAAVESQDGTKGLDLRYRMLETVRAYGLERLAEADEQAAARDAFTAYYLNLAETADPELRAAGQRRWLRELTSEQDNVHAALRWAIASRDADTALRFVRALGWYWMLRGKPGEPALLAHEVLALESRENTPRIAEARVVCALTAAGAAWDMDAVRPALAAAVADFTRWSPDAVMTNPVAAMGEPMLALYDRHLDRAFEVFDRYARSEDPWLRAATPLLRGTFGSMLGRVESSEADCRESLAAFRSIGEVWGAAAVLVQLTEFAQLRGDYPSAIAALEEAASLASDLGSWGDLSHFGGKLAAVRLRMGDLAGARAELEQAERDEANRGAGPGDTAVWLGLVRAELHCREGDAAAVTRQCEKALAWLEGHQSTWFNGLRALIQARLALTLLTEGDEARCHGLLADALRAAAEWVERPVLATVIEAVAVLAQHPGQAQPLPPSPASPSAPVSPSAPAGASLAATLLGASHSIRGCFDEGSLDAPAARDRARALLGDAEFETAYARGRSLERDAAVALASRTVANPAEVIDGTLNG
jgi:predicted ATPase/DNA-binding SARP family transcriptional activator